MKSLAKYSILKILTIFLWAMSLISIIESTSAIIGFNYFLGDKNALIQLHKSESTHLMKDDLFYEWIEKNKELCHGFNEITSSILLQSIFFSLSSFLIFVFIFKNKWASFLLVVIPLSFWMKINTEKYNIYLPENEDYIDLDYFVCNVIKIGENMLISSCVLYLLAFLVIFFLSKRYFSKKHARKRGAIQPLQ